MNDLVKRLRDKQAHSAEAFQCEEYMPMAAFWDSYAMLSQEAADHIEAQAKIIEELFEALRPFALVEIWDISSSDSSLDLYKPMPEKYAVGPVLRVGDFRNASEVWSKVPDRFLPKSNPNTPDRNDE